MRTFLPVSIVLDPFYAKSARLKSTQEVALLSTSLSTKARDIMHFLSHHKVYPRVFHQTICTQCIKSTQFERILSKAHTCNRDVKFTCTLWPTFRHETNIFFSTLDLKKKYYICPNVLIVFLCISILQWRKVGFSYNVYIFKIIFIIIIHRTSHTECKNPRWRSGSRIEESSGGNRTCRCRSVN